VNINSVMPKILNALKNLDLFPKTVEEAKEKSLAGAIVSLLGFAVITYLAISEFNEYFDVAREDVLSVYTERNQRLPINFRITFFNLPCDAINLDVTNRFGEEFMSGNDVNQRIALVKRAWSGNFDQSSSEVTKTEQPLGKTLYERELKLWNILGSQMLVKPQECLPCYDASKLSTKYKCCNNCLQLKAAYAMTGLSIYDADALPQCQAAPEGCLVSGYTMVDKVQGSFHIAVGQSHSEQGEKHHHHWDAPMRQLGFNTSHYIHHFSFGTEYPGMSNPLDGTMFIEKGLGQKQYFFQVVPTTFIKSNGRKIQTNQYSVSDHYNPINLNGEAIELPGVFFKYDVSPIQVKMEEKQMSLSHLIVRIFAIVGGIWALLGLLYTYLKSFIEKVIHALQ